MTTATTDLKLTFEMKADAPTAEALRRLAEASGQSLGAYLDAFIAQQVNTLAARPATPPDWLADLKPAAGKNGMAALFGRWPADAEDIEDEPQPNEPNRRERVINRRGRVLARAIIGKRPSAVASQDQSESTNVEQGAAFANDSVLGTFASDNFGNAATRDTVDNSVEAQPASVSGRRGEDIG